MLTKSFYRVTAIIFFAASVSICLVACGDGDYYENEPVDEPYDGYSDNYDQDCVDVGEEVWVGDDDPDGLDADGDGWGCEAWP